MPDDDVKVEANSKVTARVVATVIQDEQYADLTPDEFHDIVLAPANMRCRGCYAPGAAAPGETNTTADPALETHRQFYRHLVEDRREIARTPAIALQPVGLAHEAFHALLRQLGKECYLCKGRVHYVRSLLAVLLALGLLLAAAAPSGALLFAVGASLIVNRGLQSTAERRAGISTTGLGAAWDAMGFSDNPGAFAAGDTELVVGAGANRSALALDGTPTRSSQTVSYVRTLLSTEVLYTIKQVALLNGGAGVFTALCAGIDGLTLTHGAFKMKWTIELTDSN